MENNQTLAIIGAGNMALEYAKAARINNITTLCFAWAEGAVAKEYVDRFYDISIFEKDEILNICKSLNVDGIVPTTELTIPIAAYIADKMGLNSMGYELSQVITQKSWVREKTKFCNNIRNPQFCIVHADEYDKSINEWSFFPAVVKPVSEGGKRGVIVVNKKDELAQAVQYSIQYDKKNNGVIIEQFIGGDKEYSVESLSCCGNHDIIQITEKISSGPPHCVELGHHQPADLPAHIREKIVLAIKELLNTVGFLNGPTHTEIKVFLGEIWLVELNARPGGDHIATTLTPLSTGYDYLGESIEVALGNKPLPRNHNYNKYSGVFFVTKQTSFLKPVFDDCDNKKWLYKKHVESKELLKLSHNDCMHTNYMIYCSDHRISLEIASPAT